MFDYLRNRSLFNQLIAPMVVVGIIGVGAIIASAFALQHSVKALGEMYSASGERLKTLQDIDKGIANVRALSLKHLASESAQDMIRIRTDLDSVEQRIKLNLPAISDHDVYAHQATRQEAAVLGNVLATYLAGIDEALLLSSEFEKESAFELLTRIENQHLTNIQRAMQTLMQHTIEDIAASREDLIAATNRNVQINLAIGFLGGAMLLGMAFYVSRRASVRIADLLKWSQRIADGDLANHLVSDAGDEIGQLTHAMRDMVQNLARGRGELEQARIDAETVAEELRQYANAFHSSGEAMMISDRFNRIVNVNATFTAQTGYSLDEVRGKDPHVLSSGKTPRAVYEDMWRCLQDKSYWHGELLDRKKTGEEYPKWTSISAIRDAEQKVMFYIASYSDISERKANEARIDYLAHHDPLTGLINRYNLENRLDQALLSAHRDGLRVAVMFIDMDRFKTINDTLGHHVGDQLLIEVARRLRESVRESDIVARLGGDEFIVVLTRITDDMDAAPLGDKILRSLGQPYLFDGKELRSTPSIGIAVYPSDGEDGPTLMKNADTAMYHAKELGRNNVQYFTPAMNAAASERMGLENDLHQALRTGQLHLHYQPQVCAGDGRCFGVEALARWRHPLLGDISPLKFIPIAEESSLIEALGSWVLEEACRQLGAWRAEGIEDIRMAVNLSAQQLRSPGFVQSVDAALKRHGLKGSDLELEITESVAMENPERAIGQLQALRDLGILLAIDDFGTGYSSLAYLKRLPIQVLKLDRAFVRDIETDPSDAEISAATLALAHNLGLKVIAEGVETEAQRDYLIQHQCDFMQGYLFSEPLPPEDALKFILEHCPARVT
ncbi:MAG TPA: EAL domain-containing protein [Thiobacillus sp.]|nr:EAL domain-containing protein [Thiobacillus sp.]